MNAPHSTPEASRCSSPTCASEQPLSTSISDLAQRLSRHSLSRRDESSDSSSAEPSPTFSHPFFQQPLSPIQDASPMFQDRFAKDEDMPSPFETREAPCIPRTLTPPSIAEQHEGMVELAGMRDPFAPSRISSRRSRSSTPAVSRSSRPSTGSSVSSANRITKSRSPPPFSGSSLNIRRRRQNAVRRQCSSSHVDEIRAMVQRMVEQGEDCEVCQGALGTDENQRDGALPEIDGSMEVDASDGTPLQQQEPIIWRASSWGFDSGRCSPSYVEYDVRWNGGREAAVR